MTCASKNTITKFKAYNSIRFDYHGNCSQLCPLECNQVTFESNENHDTLHDSHILTLQFIYSDNQYTEVKQDRKTTKTQWVANNGGLLGF